MLPDPRRMLRGAHSLRERLPMVTRGRVRVLENRVGRAHRGPRRITNKLRRRVPLGLDPICSPLCFFFLLSFSLPDCLNSILSPLSTFFYICFQSPLDLTLLSRVSLDTSDNFICARVLSFLPFYFFFHRIFEYTFWPWTDCWGENKRSLTHHPSLASSDLGFINISSTHGFLLLHIYIYTACPPRVLRPFPSTSLISDPFWRLTLTS